MKISEMKKELEGYGISTVNILEKSDLVSALEKAKADRRRGFFNPNPPPTGTAKRAKIVPTVDAENTKSTTTCSRGGSLLKDGEDRFVQGSGKNPYKVTRRGAVYACTCPGWKFQHINIALRTCKHISGIQGEQFEMMRTNTNASTMKKATPTSKKATTKAKAKAGSKVNEKNGSLLPFSGVMLANKYEESKHGTKLSSSVWWMSEKFDGLRAVWDGSTFMSRAGNKFYAPAEFVKDFPKNVVLDGELFCGRKAFDLASGLVRSFGGTYEKWNGKVTYEVFDAPLLPGKFEDRMEKLKTIVPQLKHANLVEQRLVRDASHVTTALAAIEAIDGEGLMLRRGGSMYENKRSSSLLKVKSMLDAEANVIGHTNGTGRNADRLGALVCTYNGKTFKVGSGLTDVERANPPAIGTTITFGYFELTKAGIPRFPTFKRVFSGH